MARATYLPVVKMERDDRFRFWTDKSYYFYGNMLVTPFVTGMETRRGDFGSDADKLTIFADSGGYQITTMNKKIEPFAVLRWQEKIADVGFTLDVPPHSVCGDYSDKMFRKCMAKSNENADIMWQYKQNDEMELWGIIQGKDIDECMDWYEDLTKEYEYDGYSVALSINVGTKDKTPWIKQLMFAKSIPKRFHFLGWSEPLFVIVLAKLAKVMNIDYTYDTSTANIGARFGKYIDPTSFHHIWLSKKRKNRSNISELPCDCPVCSKHTVKDMCWVPELITLHNLFVKFNFCNSVNTKVGDDDKFKELVNKYIQSNPTYRNHHASIVSQIMNLIYGEFDSSYMENVRS